MKPDLMSGRGERLIALTASFLAVATVIVSLRCYVRIFMRSSFGLDDGLAIASLVFSPIGLDLHFPGVSRRMKISSTYLVTNRFSLPLQLHSL
jgi:hypothetical protein